MSKPAKPSIIGKFATFFPGTFEDKTRRTGPCRILCAVGRGFYLVSSLRPSDAGSQWVIAAKDLKNCHVFDSLEQLMEFRREHESSTW